MTIQNMFNKAKGQTLTQDGCETDVEDKIYNIGDISQKTGLQKTANGWVKPRNGKAPGAKTGPGKSPEAAGEKWKENTDYLGRKRISMETPQGGKVSIYESENPKQKNARFRVDTGDHYNEFNTMEEAKAFAEKHHGAGSESKPAKSKPGAKRDTDPQTYIVKKNDELRSMFLKEKDPAKKAAMKKALQKQASMMEKEPFAPGEEARKADAEDCAPRVLTKDTKIRVRKA